MDRNGEGGFPLYTHFLFRHQGILPIILETLYFLV